MAKTTISTFQLFKLFPDQDTARLYLESRLWPNGVTCPVCRKGERITTRKGGYYRCNACSEDFTVRTGTIFERSHVALHKWLYAMYLLVTARKGISSLQLAKEIGVTQKTAWFLLHRCRHGWQAPDLQGVDSMSPTRRKDPPQPIRVDRANYLLEALKALRIDANRLCDRQLGGSYEHDCRRAIAVADAAIAKAEGK